MLGRFHLRLDRVVGARGLAFAGLTPCRAEGAVLFCWERVVGIGEIRAFRDGVRSFGECQVCSQLAEIDR